MHNKAKKVYNIVGHQQNTDTMIDDYTKLKKRALYDYYHKVNALYKQYAGTAAEAYLYKEKDKAIDEIIAFEEARLKGRKEERLKTAN